MATTQTRSKTPVKTSAKSAAKRKKKPAAKAKGWRTARTSDRHELYELSVQEPSAEIAFMERAFRERFGSFCLGCAPGGVAINSFSHFSLQLCRGG